VRDQLKFTEEEARVMRRRLRQAAAGLINADDVDVVDDDDNDDDDERPNAKTTKTSSEPRATGVFASADKDKEDSELRMQLDSAEHEVRSIVPVKLPLTCLFDLRSRSLPALTLLSRHEFCITFVTI